MNLRIFITALLLCFWCGKSFSESSISEKTDRIIHCIYIIDSKDSRLETITNNMNKDLEIELGNMQRSLNASLIKYYVTGKQFNSEDCRKIIDNIEVKTLKDIILVMVLTHGNRSKNGEQYPDIKFSNNDSRPFVEIMDLILEKKPSHLFSIVNSCNHLSEEKNEGEKIGSSFGNCNKPIGSLSEEAYRYLYRPLDFTMAITFLSAQRGTAVLVDKNGGTPFQAIMKALQHCTSNQWTGNQHATWSDIMRIAGILNICNTEEDKRTECPYAELVKVEVNEEQIIKDGEAIVFCK